ERKRQEEVLKNILHIHLPPAEEELRTALQEESEQNALVKRLKLSPGSSEFADVLARSVSGIGTLASTATKVHKALTQVGASVRSYLESPGFSEFERALDDRLMSGQVKGTDVAKFLEAVEVLRSNFTKRNEVRFREQLEQL